MEPDELARTRTILLVEDDEQIRRWIHVQLEERGYNLLEAANGADALLIAELHRGEIDLIVTDVMMPKVNGPKLVAALLGVRPGVKVLYMSGHPEPLLKKEAGLPADITFLAKPFPMTTLLTIITLLLESPNAA